jgi:hypothetical protein
VSLFYFLSSFQCFYIIGLGDPLTSLAGGDSGNGYGDDDEKENSSGHQHLLVEYPPFVLRLVEIMEILLEKNQGKEVVRVVQAINTIIV